MKKCSKCKQEKDNSCFSVGNRYKDKLTCWCKECYQKYRESPHGAEQKLKYTLKRYYNITLAEYDEMLKEQNSGCAICGGHNSDGRRLHVDHDHATGKVRGLLCNNCNYGIGHLKENFEIFYSAINYLKKHKSNLEAK